MEALVRYTRLVEEGLRNLQFPEKPEQLYEPQKYILQLGGKRIRPVLTLLGAELFDTEAQIALPQALAIETFHNFTLIHDDIMDEAPLRRNQPTVHHKWNANVAILAGDALMIRAYQLLGQIHPSLFPDAFQLFNTTALEVCEGQQVDMDFEERIDVSAAEYIEMIRLKTSVLLGCALELGAIVAGATIDDRNHLYEFGQQIGIAFQIQDDILDLYADPDKFGKQVGGDVIANKKTILFLTALNVASAEQREILKQLSKETDLILKVKRTRELFDHLNVRQMCEDRMKEHYNLAMSALGKVTVTDSKKKSLIELADFLMLRDV